MTYWMSWLCLWMLALAPSLIGAVYAARYGLAYKPEAAFWAGALTASYVFALAGFLKEAFGNKAQVIYRFRRSYDPAVIACVFGTLLIFGPMDLGLIRVGSVPA